MSRQKDFYWGFFIVLIVFYQNCHNVNSGSTTQSITLEQVVQWFQDIKAYYDRTGQLVVKPVLKNLNPIEYLLAGKNPIVNAGLSVQDVEDIHKSPRGFLWPSFDKISVYNLVQLNSYSRVFGDTEYVLSLDVSVWDKILKQYVFGTQIVPGTSTISPVLFPANIDSKCLLLSLITTFQFGSLLKTSKKDHIFLRNNVGFNFDKVRPIPWHKKSKKFETPEDKIPLELDVVLQPKLIGQKYAKASVMIFYPVSTAQPLLDDLKTLQSKIYCY